MPIVGKGEVVITPSYRGFRKSVAVEASRAATEGGNKLTKSLSDAGAKAGKQSGAKFKAGFKGAESALSATTKALETEVAKQTQVWSASRLKMLDAAGKVRVAEAALADVRSKSAVGSARVIAAEERLSSAERSLVTAQEKVKTTSDAMADAKQRLAAAATQSASATTSSTSRFTEFFSRVGSGAPKSQSLMSRFTKSVRGGLSTLTGGFISAEGGLKGLVGGFVALAGAASIKKFLSSSIAAFTALNTQVKSLQRLTGGSAKSTSELAGAMQLSGVDTSKANTMLTIFSKKVAAANSGNKTALATFSGLGVKVKDSNGQLLSTDKLLPKVADKFASMPDGIEKTALATQLFGRSGTALLPFLNKGSAGIAELKAKATDLGLVLDDGAQKKFADYRQSSRLLSATMQGLKVTIGGALLPVVTGFNNFIVGSVTPGVQALILAFKGKGPLASFAAAVQSVFTTVSGVVSTTFNGWLTAAKPVLANLQAAFSAVFSSLGPVFASLGPVFAQLGPQLAAVFQAFSPFGTLLQAITPILPQLVQSLGQMTASLGAGLSAALTALLPTLQSVVSMIATQLSATIAQLLPVVVQLVSALGPILQQVLTALGPILAMVASTFGQIVTACAPLISQLGELIAPLADLVATVIPPLVDNLTNLLKPALAIIGTVVKAVVPYISGLMDVLSGLITFVTGVISGDWSKAWSGLQKAVSGAVKTVVSAVSGIYDTVMAVFTNVGNWLLDVGKNLIQGLVDGISDAVEWVKNAIGDVVNTAIDWAKGLLGIHSPSTVFKAIGQYLGQGFAVGITGSTSQVLSALSSMLSKVTSAAEKRATQLAAVNKKILAAQSVLSDSSSSAKQKAAARSTLADLREQKAALKAVTAAEIAASKAAVAAQKKSGATLAAKGEKGTVTLSSAVAAVASSRSPLKTAAAENVTLTGLAKARTLIADRLKTANSALADAIKVRDDYSAAVKSAIVAQGNVVSLLSATEQTATSTVTSTSTVNGATVVSSSQVSSTTNGGSKGIIAGLRAKISNAKAFKSKLSTLRSWGLDSVTLQQLVEDFQSSGSLDAVNALVAGGKTDVKSISSLQASLSSEASSIGTYTSKALYQAGVNSALGLVDGLKSQLALVNSAASSLSDALVKSLKKKLGIASPSRVVRYQVGQQVGAGVVLGMQDTSSSVKAAAQSMADAAVATVGSASVGSSSSLSSSWLNLPVILNGKIIAWIKQVAKDQAEVVFADATLAGQLASA